MRDNNGSLWTRHDAVYVSTHQSELDACLAQAAELLGQPALPVWLQWELEKSLWERLTLEARVGLGRAPAVLSLDRSKRGHEMVIGIERYRWQAGEDTIRLARVVTPCACHVNDFWAVPRDQIRRFYRLLRRHLCRQAAPAPVMHDHERKRLWDNTVGFLRSGQTELRRYGVPPKRGVLLLGEPGNGKTTACRWLASEAHRRGLEWKTVTAEMYDDARTARQVPALFHLDSPGIILFDDFDAPLRDRRDGQESDKHSTFLSELDGMEQKQGLVFLFTTNARLDELDPAMCRPGRLDVIVRFPRPDAHLRRQLIRARWHADLIAGVDVETVVADTRGFSFAEIEEARKLLVLRYVETRRWDWPWVRQAMCERGTSSRARKPIGFRWHEANRLHSGNGLLSIDGSACDDEEL